MYSSKYAPKREDVSPLQAAVAAPTTQTDSAQTPDPEPAHLQEPAPPIASSIEPAYTMDPLVDEFAQTRPPDDLFDDDFTPVAESQLVYDPPPQAPAAQPEPTFREPRYSNASKGELPRGVPRGPRGRGRGSGRGANTSAAASAPKSSSNTGTASTNTQDGAAAAANGSDEAKTAVDAASTSPPASAPTGPAAGKPVPSVRGDRSLTGGPAKKKLTEDELNAKLAAMSLKNKALTEAHEKAQADQDAFAEREKIAAEKRRIERLERQALMGEREKNRQRKLQVMSGREWDAGKNEDDFKDEGRRARRGAHGGIAGTRHAAPVGGEGDGDVPNGGDGAQRDGHEGSRGRGRGRGGRGRGRGDHHNHHHHHSTPHKKDVQQSVPTSADFPELPSAAPPPKTDGGLPRDLEFPLKKKAATTETPARIDTTPHKNGAAATAEENTTKAAAAQGESRPQLDKQTSFGFSPAAEKRSWADQMDATSP
ncbi:uncharacterized protein PV09_08963 [Verruconis gallopava]|uniref:Uncharacterized protein n=1 Tax=Verruconis gallopava TaxID=253628 RepID=A0A0D2AIP9_9PEZI|nr:uncharacterized protein PV09_09422 [Verruconis gallopava]XP_016209172.1 uncharacterized protein PV09_08963 [Verruconis gallopava]KIV98808.1 hypothetical protein PV09_09422 [Verruconis gallopava]KIV99302.1 hypothetical protein PV09_08963 [Verruconis gallopava]